MQTRARHAGDDLAKQGDFDNALERYRLAGADDRVKEIEAIVVAREKIWQRYKEAKEAFVNHCQDEAVRAFADVVYLQPDFEDAAVQLAAIVTRKRPVGEPANGPSEGIWGNTIFRPVFTSWLRCIVPTITACGAAAYYFVSWSYLTSWRAMLFAAFITVGSVLVLAALESLVGVVISLFSAKLRVDHSYRFSAFKRTVLLIMVSYPLLAFVFFNLGWYFEPHFADDAFWANFRHEVAFLAGLLPLFLIIATVRRGIAQ